ncbi:MAG: ABC transporter, substrate-binding protein (cluster 13, osmolytes) [uncultured Frankineae bacterium]|uniref:ABC transporter, substrate-binding protein (Cluster 13, osmolytes) n=1 Tax=uncultured Frankineae bacterium TaxID=437475 RepID=A0A6J4KRF3_9ACTN|nr:MAG: ABC transporter, substrate-binding protein (cluster 13, osmolytes) [uncultured Frankineae bacterium]
MTTRATWAAITVGLSLAMAGCGGDSTSDSAAGGGDGELAGATLTVGSKEFTESILLGKITALALENAGAEVEDSTGISGSATVRAALESKEIDIYWDYTGTGWVNILGNSPTDLPDDLYEAVKTADAENGIAWLEPAPFENAYAIATTSDFAKDNDVTTLSDAVQYIEDNPDDGVICAASEFLNRDDGLPGLEKAYGTKFTEVNELDFNLIFTQVGESCAFGEVTTTEGRVLSQDLQILEDDKDFFLEYLGVVTLRQETLDEHPEIEEIMAPISEALTNDTITELNSKVDVEGQQPDDVAQEWMESEGFLG